MKPNFRIAKVSMASTFELLWNSYESLDAAKKAALDLFAADPSVPYLVVQECGIVYPTATWETAGDRRPINLYFPENQLPPYQPKEIQQ